MKRPNQNHFAAVPSVGMQRSAFDMPFTYKTTMDAGYIIPCMQPIEILPGDSLSLRLTSFARLATLLTPIMDNLKMAYFFFFVPNRLVWDDWEEFICADVNGPQGTIPQVASGDAGFAVGSLADYFGLPVGVGGLSVSALPFRAYNLIFNEWFLRESLMTSAVVNTGSSDEDWTDGDYVLRRRAKRPDYFVSSNLWPQKGPGVELPLGGTAPVVGNGTPPSFISITNNNVLGSLQTSIEGGSFDGFLKAAGGSPTAGVGQSVGFSTNGEYSGLVADLSSATAATINSLRQAFQIQRLYERDALAGNGRYVEVLKSHFQVTSPDARLQRPEYLGGGVVPVSIHTVTSTADTNQISLQDGGLLGQVGGNGVMASDGIGFSKSFVEHGFVIGLCCIYGEQTYQRTVDRQWSRKGRFDFYWPVLAHLGEQAVLNKEIYSQGSSVTDADGNIIDDKPFGYQERWAEYRYGASKITGKLRSGVLGSLDVWHLAQSYANLPQLGETFIEENPPISRVVAVSDEPQFIYDSVIRARFVRPMPMYSVPGLVDHF